MLISSGYFLKLVSIVLSLEARPWWAWAGGPLGGWVCCWAGVPLDGWADGCAAWQVGRWVGQWVGGRMCCWVDDSPGWSWAGRESVGTAASGGVCVSAGCCRHGLRLAEAPSSEACTPPTRCVLAGVAVFALLNTLNVVWFGKLVQLVRRERSERQAGSEPPAAVEGKSSSGRQAGSELPAAASKGKLKAAADAGGLHLTAVSGRAACKTD